MKPWQIFALIFCFYAMFEFLTWLLPKIFNRRMPDDDDARIQELLDHEQAAHDAFMRRLDRE